MPRPKRHKYLYSDRDRHGNIRYYVCRPGRRKVRIRQDPDSKDFEEIYRAALVAPRVPLETKQTFRRGHFLYVIGHGYRPLKIGHSRNPRARLADMQVANHRPMHIRRLFLLPSMVAAQAIEKAAHEDLAKYRLKGEWFDITTRTAENVIRRIAQDLESEIIDYSAEFKNGR